MLQHRPSISRQKRTFVSLSVSPSDTPTEASISNPSSNVAATTSHNNSTEANEDTHPTRKLRVAELKKALDEWNVKYDDCFDQESLLVRYNEALLLKGQSPTEPQLDVSATTAAAPRTTSKDVIEQPSEEMILQSIRQMTVKQLREELGQRRISRVGLLEKSDLVRAVYDARRIAQQFSVTGLLQPYQVNEVTGDQLQREIQNDSNVAVTTPLLVDVYATWCGPCQLMSKQLVDAAEELGDTIRIVKLVSDQYTDLSSQLRIQGLPTILLYSPDGTEIKRMEGAMMKDQLIQWIRQQLPSKET
jgi:thiol-disulfide isomerase/thioredoxin